MIYRYEVKNVYYAGINYASRVEGVVSQYNKYTFTRMDIWEYRDAKSRERIIYRGVDLTKGIYYLYTATAFDEYWEKSNDNCHYNIEEYPDDL